MSSLPAHGHPQFNGTDPYCLALLSRGPTHPLFTDAPSLPGSGLQAPLLWSEAASPASDRRQIPQGWQQSPTPTLSWCPHRPHYQQGLRRLDAGNAGTAWRVRLRWGSLPFSRPPLAKPRPELCPILECLGAETGQPSPPWEPTRQASGNPPGTNPLLTC